MQFKRNFVKFQENLFDLSVKGGALDWYFLLFHKIFWTIRPGIFK